MARPWSLSTRVRMILARGLDRAPLTRGRAVSMGFAALLVALPLASLDMLQGRDPVDARMLELRDDDPHVRRHAAWALGELEDSSGLGPLIERLGDENADVRLVAAWALGEIKEEAAIQPLISLLEDADRLVREMAVLSLGEIEDAAAIEPLTVALQRHSERRETRSSPGGVAGHTGTTRSGPGT
jgi:HEAT repeat protein